MSADDPTSATAGPTSDGGGRSTFRRFLPLLVVLGAAALLVVVAVVSPFETTDPDIDVEQAYVGAGSDPAGGYLVVRNEGGSDDLVEVVSPLGPVTLQRRVVDEATGDAVLRPVDALRIDGFDETRLQPGSDQLLIAVGDDPPAAGTATTLELRFRVSDPITLEVPVLTYDEIGTILLPPILDDGGGS